MIFAFSANTFSQSWQDLNAPLGITIADINRSNNSIFGTANGFGIHRSFDGGATWSTAATQPVPGTYTYQHFTCTNSGTLLVGLLDYGSTYGTMFPFLRSTDNGDSWTYIAPFPYGTSKFFLPANNKIFAIASGSYGSFLLLSTDDGLTFITVADSILDIAIAANNDIYALMQKDYNSNKLVKSTDGGTTWSNLTATGMPAFPYKIICCPNGNLFVTDGSNSNPAVRSTDGGNTFSTIGNIFAYLWNDYNNNVFGYKASALEAYRSTDNGVTWQLTTPNLTLPNVISHPNGNVYASAAGKIYKLTGTSGINDNSLTNSEIDIFPNPSHGIFQVKSTQHPISAIEIFNANGENILQKMESGEIDLSGSPKGIYVVKVTLGTKRYTRKIVVQ